MNRASLMPLLFLPHIVGGCVDFDDPCLSQCELGLRVCLDLELTDFADFDATRDEWRAEPICVDTFPFLNMVAGRCATGESFLYESGGFVSTINFYDGVDGQFISLLTSTDGIEPVCLGIGYWPFKMECADAVITEVICGEGFTVGDTVSLFQ